MTRDEFVATLDLSRVAAAHADDATLEPTMAPVYRGHGPLTRPRSTPEREELSGSGNTIRVTGPLAEGGMGLIRVAEQGALRREVAVKTLRDEFLDEEFIARFVREARITGLVEHPNIVPVYALQVDSRGAPMMVMKRIEGVSWRALIRYPLHPSRLVDAKDALAWHLRVLMQVCDAIHYAHSRGILHLDLKPDNVMVGNFRDVYVVDWGVACSMREEHRGLLPMADEVAEVIGTPAYIAPEMVDVEHARLGPFTDVYLLGAMLYEVLEGHPPHRGDTLHDILFSAYEGRVPSLADAVPAELVAIVRTALDPIPSRRFESVEHFRHAIEGYLQHRSSASLAAESHRLLDALRVDLREAPEDPADPVAQSIHRRFSECRFGFAQALREWPENREADEGLAEATLLLAGHHLDRGDAASAEALLAELREPAAYFGPRIEALREGIRLARLESEKLQRLGEEMDDVSSRRARAIFVIVLSSTLLGPVLLFIVLQALGAYRWVGWHSIVYTGLLVLLLGFVAVVMRRELMPNRLSRRYVTSLFFLSVMVFLRRVMATSLGYDGMEDVSMDVFLFGAGCGVIGMLTDRRFMAPASAFLVASVPTAIWPRYALVFTFVAGVLGPGSMAYLWLRSDEKLRRRQREGDSRRPRRRSSSP